MILTDKSLSGTSLEPYKPNSKKQWNKTRLTHLLRRTRFTLPSKTELEQKLKMEPISVIDEIFNVSQYTNAPNWINEAALPITDENREKIKNQTDELINWWINLCYSDNTIREKMVYFYANHFVVELRKVRYPQYIYKIFDAYRKYALGNFRELTKVVTKEPAMLIYLDGVRNRKGAINENYARELQELFTIGRGNYTQQDVSEAAKALSGWAVNSDTLTSYLIPRNFDDSIKNFYGRKGNFNGDDIINIIFEREETSKFIARKLYTFFVYMDADEEIVEQLAKIIKQDDYNIERAVKILISSEHFFDDKFIGSDIKSPLDYTLGILKILNAKQEAIAMTINSLSGMGQAVFNPPDVAGWDGHRTWMNATYLSNRNSYVNNLLSDKYLPSLDIDGLIARYNTSNPKGFITNLLEDTVSLPISEDIINILSNELSKNQTTFDLSQQTGKRNLINVLKIIFKMPEFQLL